MQARALAEALGVTLVRRFAGGEGNGAYEVSLPDGRRAVLKLDDGDHLDFERAARVTAALRARGYPAPATIRLGSVQHVRYALSELLSGEPMVSPTDAQVARLVELVDLHRGMGLPPSRQWVDDVVTSITEGRHGWCEHGAMQAYSPVTARLLERLQRIADGARDLDVAHDDVVHMDFAPGNVLVADEHVSGVVDWEGCTSGDRAFDLVTMALYAYEIDVRDALLGAAHARTDPRAVHLYAAHMVLRQVDWSIRHHDAAQIEWFYGLGTALLAATRA